MSPDEIRQTVSRHHAALIQELTAGREDLENEEWTDFLTSLTWALAAAIVAGLELPDEVEADIHKAIAEAAVQAVGAYKTAEQAAAAPTQPETAAISQSVAQPIFISAERT
jgi:hypothetical protein